MTAGVRGYRVAGIDVVGTFLDAPAEYLSGISDMELVRVASGWRLYTAGPPGGGLLAFDTGGEGAAGLTLLDRLPLAEGAGLHAPVRLERAAVDGGDGLLVSGAHAGQLTGIDLTAGGRLDAPLRLSGGAGGVITAQAVVRLGGDSFVFSVAMFRAEITGWRLDGDGGAQRVGTTPLPRELQGIDVAAMQAVTIGAQTFLLVLSNGIDALRSYRVTAAGGLVEVSTLGAAAGLGIAAPSALAVVESGGRDYALVAGAGTSSISVVRLEPGGRMTLVDHVADTRDTRFQGVGALATATVDGRVYVIAGGGDDGISLMTLLPGGRLLLLGSQTREAGLPLDNVTALAARVEGGVIDLFAAGEGTGLMRLRIDPGPAGVEAQGGPEADALTGGAAGDRLSGEAGDDILRGGAGRDILVDGAGDDRLYGGAGADWFVLEGGSDVIHDYEPGADRIDLSAWGRLYDPADLAIRYRSNGSVTLSWGAETLALWPAPGTTIPREGFRASDLFGLWRVRGDPVHEALRLEGTEADDRMIAGGGDDTLTGSPGADRMDGKGGFDLVDYAGAAGAVAADLDGEGAGWGAGDVFFNIEGLAGGPGDDRLGGNAGANQLRGGEGRDAIGGRGGDDALQGGAGDDTLDGGAGADRLDGGAGTDTASYASAPAGVVADLADARRNAGEAAGDLWSGIEALTGSAWADTLAGGPGADTLSGGDGGDDLAGRAGADALLGGGGADRLRGGAGDDRLSGGGGADWFVAEGFAAVAVSLASGIATGEGRDRLEGIENAAGGIRADRLEGSAAVNRLQGGAGADRLSGLGGADALSGGAGADRLWGGAGRDALDGGEGADRLDGGAGGDRLRGGAGRDVFVFSGGRDAVLDASLRQGDRLAIDADDFRALRGLSERVAIDRFGFDDGRDVGLAFGPHRIVVEDLGTLRALADLLVLG